MKRFFLLVAPFALAACVTQPPAPVASPEQVLKGQVQAQAKPGGVLLPQPDTPPVGAVVVGGNGATMLPQPDTPPVAAAAAPTGMAKNGPGGAMAGTTESSLGAALIGNDGSTIGDNAGGLAPAQPLPAPAAPSMGPSSAPGPTPTPTSTPAGR